MRLLRQDFVLPRNDEGKEGLAALLAMTERKTVQVDMSSDGEHIVASSWEGVHPVVYYLKRQK